MLRSSSLVGFLRLQALYLSVAAVVAAVFWASGQQINLATVVLYSLCFGNLLTPPLHRVRRKFSGRLDHGAHCASVRDALRRSWLWDGMG
jgi:hypothetical protein